MRPRTAATTEHSREPTRSDILRTARHAVASTCYYWREIVLKIPSMWSHISVEFELEGYTSQGDSIGALRPAPQLLELELRRASARPLALRVEIDRVPRQWSVIAPLLLRSLPLCESIYLALDRESSFEDLGLHSPISFPYLHTFVLRGSPRYRDLIPLDLSRAPRLQNISFAGPYFPTNIPETQHLLRAQLHRGSSYQELCPMSHAATHLRQLSLAFRGTLVLESFDGVTLEFPVLEELSFRASYPARGYSVVLHSIKAPNLIHLQITQRKAEAYPYMNQFPSLRRLSAFGDHSWLVEGLHTMPSLTALILPIMPYCPSELLIALQRRDDLGVFALGPLLRDFTGFVRDVTQAERLFVSRNENPQSAFTMHLWNEGDFLELRSVYPRFINDMTESEDPFDCETWTAIGS